MPVTALLAVSILEIVPADRHLSLSLGAPRALRPLSTGSGVEEGDSSPIANLAGSYSNQCTY